MSAPSQHRGSLLVRLGASAGEGAEAGNHVSARSLALSLGMHEDALKDIVVEDLFIEHYSSDCQLPIAISVAGPLSEICNFLPDSRIDFAAMGILWPKHTSTVPYRLNGDSREKSVFTRAFIEQGIVDVNEKRVLLQPGSLLAEAVAQKRQEKEVTEVTLTEAENVIASLMRRRRTFDLSDGLHLRVVVAGREGGHLLERDNAYLVLGITASEPPARAPQAAAASDSESDTPIALEALRVARIDSNTTHGDLSDTSDTPLTPSFV